MCDISGQKIEYTEYRSNYGENELNQTEPGFIFIELSERRKCKAKRRIEI